MRGLAVIKKSVSPVDRNVAGRELKHFSKKWTPLAQKWTGHTGRVMQMPRNHLRNRFLDGWL